MGACSSRASVGSVSTAKVILPNGELRKFNRSIKVSDFADYDKSGYFICDADEMELDACVTEVGSDEDLELGQIYFVLPRAMLKRKLRGDDLATYAIMGSKALRKGQSTPLVFEVKERSERRRSSSSRVGGRRSFVKKMDAILEDKSLD